MLAPIYNCSLYDPPAENTNSFSPPDVCMCLACILLLLLLTCEM